VVFQGGKHLSIPPLHPLRSPLARSQVFRTDRNQIGGDAYAAQDQGDGKETSKGGERMYFAEPDRRDGDDSHVERIDKVESFQKVESGDADCQKKKEGNRGAHGTAERGSLVGSLHIGSECGGLSPGLAHNAGAGLAD
jgi:hypothetical protein